jgi:hypothetical protein
MDTYTYLLERYPEPFVHAICTGAYCVVGGNWDIFPLLDITGTRLSTADMIYAVVQSYENMQAIAESFKQEMLLANWNKAAEMFAARPPVSQEGKEAGRKTEERQARHEGRADQPWRKRHR